MFITAQFFFAKAVTTIASNFAASYLFQEMAANA
jgi:hypothetical protein